MRSRIVSGLCALAIALLVLLPADAGAVVANDLSPPDAVLVDGPLDIETGSFELLNTSDQETILFTLNQTGSTAHVASTAPDSWTPGSASHPCFSPVAFRTIPTTRAPPPGPDSHDQMPSDGEV